MNYTRPNGTGRFAALSATPAPVPSGEVDNEFNLLRTEVNKGLPKDGSEAMTGGLLLSSSTPATKVTAASKGFIEALFPGLNIRSGFAWTDGDTITISPGVYHHSGTVEQYLYWDSTITFEVGRPGAGGSNAGNEALGNNEWHYIYIDDSAVVTNASPLLVANCFLNRTTDVPAWSDAKHGWYSGLDKCIGAVRTDGSGAIWEFSHDGDYVSFAAEKGVDIGNSGSSGSKDVDTTYLDVDFPSGNANLCPAFSSRVSMHVKLILLAGGGTETYWRKKGQTATGSHTVTSVEAGVTVNHANFEASVNSSGVFEYRHSASDASESEIKINGWYFPVGM